jgi:midasin
LLALLQHPDLSIRFLAIELLCISLGIADAARIKWIDQYLGGPTNVFMAPFEHETIDYGLMLLFESERIYQANRKIQEREYFREHVGRKLNPEDLGRFTGEICGVLIPRFNVTTSPTSGLVMTENTKTNLRNIAMTIVNEKPILLQSVPGAGKSFLIDETAKLFGRFEGFSVRISVSDIDIVRITLTDQTDAKLLLGTYVTTAPGSFTWRAGILTTAVQEGKWIVIEDIDRAGNDILSVLLPLLEGRPLALSGRGDIEMGRGGQIIVTARL